MEIIIALSGHLLDTKTSQVQPGKLRFFSAPALELRA